MLIAWYTIFRKEKEVIAFPDCDWFIAIEVSSVSAEAFLKQGYISDI